MPANPASNTPLSSETEIRCNLLNSTTKLKNTSLPSQCSIRGIRECEESSSWVHYTRPLPFRPRHRLPEGNPGKPANPCVLPLLNSKFSTKLTRRLHDPD